LEYWANGQGRWFRFREDWYHFRHNDGGVFGVHIPRSVAQDATVDQQEKETLYGMRGQQPPKFPWLYGLLRAHKGNSVAATAAAKS